MVHFFGMSQLSEDRTNACFEKVAVAFFASSEHCTFVQYL
jgi:hypothetical protein